MDHLQKVVDDFMLFLYRCVAHPNATKLGRLFSEEDKSLSPRVQFQAPHEAFSSYSSLKVHFSHPIDDEHFLCWLPWLKTQLDENSYSYDNFFLCN